MECYLGDALYEQGNMEEALTHLRQSLAKAPGFAQAHYNLGNVFLQLGRTDEAILQFQEALRLRPGTADYHRQLGNAFGRQGRMAELIGQYEKVLQIRPNDLRAAGHLAWVLATSPDSSLRNGARAVELASRADRLSGGQDPVLLATLAAAYAESGKFADAVAAIQRALSHAGAQGDSPLAAALREQLALYRAGKPLREAGAALPFSSPQGQ